MASGVDRELGSAIHAALVRWQRQVDGGAKPTATGLVAAVQAAAAGRGLLGPDLDRAVERIAAGLKAYAEGPWPRCATLFLEQSVRHRLEDDRGFGVDLRLRVDRVVRYRRGIAILDFKTVPPHAFELAADEWQLRTYALASPDLLGIAPGDVRLFIIDLRSGQDRPVPSSPGHLARARRELLAAAHGIDGGNFGVAGHRNRPCWACGFRLVCPRSLAPGAGSPN